MLRLLFGLVVNLLIAVFWPLLALRRSRAAPRGAWLEVEIEGSIVELERSVPFWDRRPRPFALQRLRRAVELMASDARVAGLLVTIKDLRVGSATATALRELLLQVKQTKKRVAVYLPEGAGTRETYVASAADLVLLGPETFVAPLGFAVQTPYVRRALEQIGVEPEIFARGRYKTAGESLMADAMSEPQREQLEALLEVAWDVLLEALSAGRAVARTEAQRWIEQGPWSARSAVLEKLADSLAYADELPKKLEPNASDGARRLPLSRYLRRRSIRWRPILRRDRIALIEVKGTIVSKHFGLVPLAAQDEVCRAIETALDDSHFKAAVIYVDSGGGSAQASDRMLHALRRLAEKKPVVACMGDVAASGGYMIAVGAHSIIAQPTTITGSIGVVSARFMLRPLFDKLGVAMQVVKRGARADMFSVSRHLDSGERDAVERQLDEIYRSFVQAVATGRGRELADVEKLAGGRVWSGRDALAHGLIDRLGGFSEALQEVRQRLGPGAERLEPELISPAHLRLRRGLLPRIAQEIGLVSGSPWLVPAVAMAMTPARESAWTWCDLRETDLGAG